MKLKPLLSFFLILGLALSAGAETPETLPLENLAIPKSLGRVESRFVGKAGRWILHIQDIHAHLTAQQNISAIVDHLNEVYGIKTVALEGGWSATSLPKSWSIPASSRGKQILAQALLEQDYITGPVYSALFSKIPITLVGIEDPKLYEENRALYLKSLSDRENTLQKISILEHKIAEGKANLYNPDLLEFDKKLLDFRSGKKTETFIPYILKLAALKKIKVDDLAQITAFSKMLELQKSIDNKKLEDEGKRLQKTFKYMNLGLEELLRSGKIPADKLEFYPEAKNYLELMRSEEQIPHRELFTQIEEVIKRLKEKLIRTTDESDLDKRSESFLLARKIILLQATPQDLKAFESLEAALVSDLEDTGLQEAVALGAKFYELAKKRDQIFFDKITTDPALAGNIAVVTGGFHSEGLSEKFEAAGISYAEITPDLGEKPEPADEKIYFERLKENLPSRQTLSEQQNRYADIDPGFAKANDEYNHGEHNTEKLINIVTSYQVGAPAGPETAPAPDSESKTLSNESLKGSLDLTNSRIKTVFVIRQSILENFLKDKDSLASKIWHEVILPNPLNVVVIFNDLKNQGDGEPHIFTDTEGKAEVKAAEGSFDRVVARQLKQFGRVGVINSDFASQDQRIVALPDEPHALATVRVLLENNTWFSQTQISDIMNRMLAILQTIYNIQATNISA